MANNGDDTGETEDTGGFVFGEERTTGGERDVGDRLTDGTVVVAILLVAIVIVAVAAAAVVQPFGSGSGGAENKAPDGSAATTTAGAASGTDRAETGAVDGPAATTTIAATVTTTSATQTATATPATTETATPTESENQTGRNETETTTATDERSPVIESFTVTDRSSGGAAVFDVAWNVTDPNSDLVAVRVSLVADPDGEAKIIEQRRFDAGGAQSVGSTTFEIPDGGGEVYELRIEAVDGSGNTVFSLTRAVANGNPDE